MILPTRAEIVELNQNGTLLDAIFSDRWECRYLHFEPIAQELANAHNDGEIDLLEPFSCIALDGALDGEQNETEHGTPKRALNSFSDHRGYQGRRIYGLAIERLEACLPAVLKTLKILARLSAGEEHEVTETLSRWCSASPNRPKELLALIDSGEADPNELYSLTIAIRSGLNADLPYFAGRAFRFVQVGTAMEKAYAIEALSIPPFILEEEWRQALAILRESVAGETDDELRGALTRTLLSWTESIPADLTTDLEALISQASVPTSPKVAHHLAYALAFSFKNLSSSMRTALLSLLRAVELAPQTLKLIDLGLVHLIKEGGADDARAFIADVLLRLDSAFQFENFDSTIRRLGDGPAQDIESWIVDWLRTGPNSLCEALNDGLFNGKDTYVFQLDFDQFDFTKREIESIACRGVATFFMKPQIAASFLVGLGRCLTTLRRDSAGEDEDLNSKRLSLTPKASALSQVVRAAIKPSGWHTSARPREGARRPKMREEQASAEQASEELLPEEQQGSPSPPTQLSLVLSDLLFNPILINFTSIEEKLRTIADNKEDKAAPIVRRALDQLNQYRDALEQVGFIAELQPSERERQLEGQRRSDAMNDMMRESRQSSPLASLISERILLHGNGMVTWVDDSLLHRDENGDGEHSAKEPRRMEQFLASFSHSFELPREEVLDPIGLQMKLLTLKSQGQPKNRAYPKSQGQPE